MNGPAGPDRLAVLLDREGVGLHALLLKLTLRRDVAAELFQTLFAKLADAAGFSTADDPAAYAYRSAIHLVMDWRRRRPRDVAVGGDATVETAAAGNDPAATVLRDEAAERLLDAIEGLAGLTREAVCLHYLQQRSFAEVGALLGKSAHQARGLCHHGITQLRKRLIEPMGDDDE